jgi:hypothetical protein
MMTILLSLFLAAQLTAPLEKRTYDVAVDGPRVLAGTEAGVVFWEWKGGALERTGAVVLPDSVNALTSVPGAVLASVGPEGVFRVDLATREAKLQADTRGAAMDALLASGVLIVAEGTLGVGFYKDGKEIARIPTTGHCRGLARSGDSILAVCGTDGLLRMSAQGKPLGGFGTLGEARRLSLEGTRMAVALGKGGLDLFDIRDPERPERITHLASADGVHDAELSGGMLCTAEGKAGFHLYELDRDGKPVERGAIPTVYMANRIRPLGGKLYLAEDGGGFRVVEWNKGKAVQLHPKEGGPR